MRFEILHTTHYQYDSPASESFMEARLTAAEDDHQRVHDRSLTVEPPCTVHRYRDYFGNAVETFSIIRRHQELRMKSRSIVETRPWAPPAPALGVSVSEARQIFHSERLRLLEFMLSSDAIPLSAATFRLANRFFPPGRSISDALLRLNAWLHESFTYDTRATAVDTPLSEVLRKRRGVCQDFAQLMIAILRSAEIPARYVTGYIETENERRAAKGMQTLVGASESHAWVEVALPGGIWFPLDPTNNCQAGERHVKVAIGRDYRDTSPTRGVFKGAPTHKLNVAVTMKRIVAEPSRA